jgi:hypothetical protein
VTLGKHVISGLTLNQIRPLPASVFERLMTEAGYFRTNSAPTFRGRYFIYFEHSTFDRVEAVYSHDKKMVITAYSLSSQEIAVRGKAPHCYLLVLYAYLFSGKGVSSKYLI